MTRGARRRTVVSPTPSTEGLQRSARVFSRLAAYRNLSVLLSNGEESLSVAAAQVTASYFQALGVRLVAGRGFTAEEERPGSGAAVAVINYETWQDLGGAPSALGRTITVNAHPFTVIGVAPAGFAGTLVAFGPRLWVPLGADPLVTADAPASPGAADPATRRRNLGLVGRLRPDVTIEGANALLAGVSDGLVDRTAAGTAGVVTVHRPARTEDGDAPGDDSGLFAPLGTLAGMAAVLLLVASLNAANMQLARGTTRRKEIATRLALGAGRGRIVLQLLVEGLLLSLAGGVGGLIIGVWTLRLTAASLTPLIDESLTGSLGPDVRVVLATVAYSALGALLFALGPSLRLSRPNVFSDLRNTSPDGSRSGGRPFGGPRHLVVACQVAPALALLATAGLFVRGAVFAGRADPGYPLDHQVIVRVAAPGSAGAEGGRAFQDLVDRLRAAPGVEAASAASLVAFGSSHSSHGVEARDEDSGQGRTGAVAQHFEVGAEYFRTLGLPVLRGREFTRAEEEATGSRAVIIDEPLARELFPGRDPVGQFVEFPGRAPGTAPERYEVVGVAAGQRDRLTDIAAVPHVYRPVGASQRGQLNIHVRLATGGPPASPETLRRIRSIVRAAEPRLVMVDVSTFEQARDRVPSSWLIRAAGAAFGTLGVVALAMAVIGLYGVKAYLVARRAREIGIRMALGATPRSVIAMVLKDGSVVVGAGLLLGFALALAAGFLVSSLLVGVHPLDPLVLSLATVVLVIAVAAAGYVPARRATRIDPALAFKSE